MDLSFDVYIWRVLYIEGVNIFGVVYFVFGQRYQVYWYGFYIDWYFVGGLGCIDVKQYILVLQQLFNGGDIGNVFEFVIDEYQIYQYCIIL